jgi:hypothetical protein
MLSNFTEKPEIGRFLSAGAATGLLSALLNSAYFLVFRAATGFAGVDPTLGSIVAASLFPTLLGALGCYALARLTPRAPLFFAIVTALITLGSFEGALHPTLADGSLKPAGFDLLVMPMHVVVGSLAALLVPSLARQRLVLCWPL